MPSIEAKRRRTGGEIIMPDGQARHGAASMLAALMLVLVVAPSAQATVWPRGLSGERPSAPLTVEDPEPLPDAPATPRPHVKTQDRMTPDAPDTGAQPPTHAAPLQQGPALAPHLQQPATPKGSTNAPK